MSAGVDDHWRKSMPYCSTKHALTSLQSTAAFNIVLSVSATGLVTSYITCISCVLAKRFRREQFPASKFNLGVWGYVVNILAICFLSLVLVFLFFPAAPNPDATDMNWAVLIYGAALLFAATYYFFKGRKTYEGPVHYVRWQGQQDITEEV